MNPLDYPLESAVKHVEVPRRRRFRSRVRLLCAVDLYPLRYALYLVRGGEEEEVAEE